MVSSCRRCWTTWSWPSITAATTGGIIKSATSETGCFTSPFAAIQGALIPLNAQEAIVLYRPKSRIRQTRLPGPAQQLWLFELIQPALELIQCSMKSTLFPHWYNGGVGRVWGGL